MGNVSQSVLHLTSDGLSSNPQHQNQCHYTPLTLALDLCNNAAFQIHSGGAIISCDSILKLLQQGADPNVWLIEVVHQYRIVRQALHFAINNQLICEQELRHILELLFKYGAVIDNSGDCEPILYTAIIARPHDFKLLELLMHQGARAINRQAQTSTYTFGDISLVHLLFEYAKNTRLDKNFLFDRLTLLRNAGLEFPYFLTIQELARRTLSTLNSVEKQIPERLKNGLTHCKEFLKKPDDLSSADFVRIGGQ